MHDFVSVAVHETQGPEWQCAELVRALRARQVPNRFHYESPRQTLRWLALHQAHSPACADPDCAAVYDHAFEAAALATRPGAVHVIGLGAGGGQKDARLLRRLQDRAVEVDYSPVDSSVPMLLVARRAALEVLSAERCHPVACDLAAALDLPACLDGLVPPTRPRLVTFFGLMPNFEPQVILPRVAALLRAGDRLLLSANLAPGHDYAAGVRQILPQYDNALCREWLATFLTDWGVEAGADELEFSVEPCPSVVGLLRVEAGYRFRDRVSLSVGGEAILYEAGERLRVFYSYRHTPALLRRVLEPWGLREACSWITRSGEEGLFAFERV